ncbi:ribonuclease TUDOR 1 [Nicotiana sylvestris]|uniref:Ribonuclease n=1 Tax=Nicotiana sylvestris TaxID=4096 RepID=A0A1U7WAW0_NICSY|nr:PREDICTED: staphylococcal nuclease domain-containing protein 1 isoform X1 [Nicotiana sylvestris]XP_009775771.1 PREDICTED: staphylococcal nuclease domain-containing protein 1 isoform X1 [Nicotiana sylvestris]XP_009775778.1 PREDICTED: staphylococcal nuclease domain-containing protein 1 isoform X2 [Nicotiana sylvestris]
MASTGWLKGRVKAVPSGDSLVIMGSSKAEIPPEKSITLASLMAPRLARRGGVDEPFAWQSREFLRKLCIGKEVTFKVEYTVPSIGREYGTVFLGDKNVSMLVVASGWAKVREQGQQKDANPYLKPLQDAEEQAKQQGLGRWSRAPGASEASIRNLPPSAIGDPSIFDARGLLEENKGKLIEAFVEQVRDGSTLRVYLLPDFQFIQVFIAGIQAPTMGRRATSETVVNASITSDEPNGESTTEPRATPTTAQRLAASAASVSEVAPDPYGREAKHFTETRVLNRDVRIVLEGVDKFSNLIGSVYYPDGESAKNLGLELVENGYAKYVDWSANMLEGEVKKQLKDAELQAKKTRLRIWTNYVPPATNSKAIHDQNFTGKVVEVVSGDCLIIADDSLPFGHPSAERRVNLSSIRTPKMGNPRRDEKPAPYAREAKEFLRNRLIGRQVHVSMEYSRKVGMADGPGAPASGTDSRVMDFGSVFLASKDGDDASPAPSAAGNQLAGVNVAELLVGRGFATVVRHRDFEERSNYYDALLSAESRAISGKKGMHSPKEPPVMHVTDLLAGPSKKARDFLPFLQRNRRMSAVVEYVLSGHRFKLFIPKETCSIAFSISGVRCPGRDEPYSEEAIALMRRKIMQRDVEIEVETVDRTGTFLGTLWESRSNVAVTLLEAGLARLQTSFGTDRIQDAHLLMQAEQAAKRQKLKVWENYVEGEEVANGGAAEKRQKEEVKVTVTEVLGGGKFYVQLVSDQKVAAIQKQLASLNLQEAPVIGAFNPKKGDIVLAQFSADNSWNRAMIVNAPRGAVESSKDKFEVFYIDYGNQEVVSYSQLRPLEASVSSSPGLAQLCSLAHVKVPGLEDDYGQEAAYRLSELLLSGPKEFRAAIEEKDASGGKVKGQGTGTIFLVTLVDPETDVSINATLLKEGLARMEKRRRWEPKDKQQALDELEKYQTEARQKRLAMWEYGDVESDDEDSAIPAKKAAGKR